MRNFRTWFIKYDSAAWDEQIEEDILEGKLNKIAQEAITEHRKGRSKQI